MTSCKDLLKAKKNRDDLLQQYNGINFTFRKKWLELPLNRKTLITGNQLWHKSRISINKSTSQGLTIGDSKKILSQIC